jgi:hypothetical protein
MPILLSHLVSLLRTLVIPFNLNGQRKKSDEIMQKYALSSKTFSNFQLNDRSLTASNLSQ